MMSERSFFFEFYRPEEILAIILIVGKTHLFQYDEQNLYVLSFEAFKPSNYTGSVGFYPE